MTKTASHLAPDRSRLVCLLAELSAAKGDTGQRNLAEQLGRLIDLSDSVTLANALGQQPRKAALKMVDSPSDVQDDLLKSRERMMRAITRSFAPETGATRIKVPSARRNVTADQLTSFEPFQRFYTMHQSEMEASIQSLRLRLREGVAGFSTELSQLANLDATLADSLNVHTRRLFSMVPRLLETRFTQLRQQHREQHPSAEEDQDFTAWLEPDAWLAQFYSDMRSLLLAELDVRLQPLLGLLEALNAKEEHTL